MKKFRKILTMIWITAIVTGIALNAESFYSNIIIAQASGTKEADLRFIFTTDLHGQLNSMDYERGVEYNYGGLARAYDLIKKARNEKPKGNSFTFDIGDIMYDYTTEYIFAEDQKAIQPIYKAMSKIGYDAITLGNHDFEYGYDYILNQLKGSGVMDLAVVSNVTDSRTGKYPFKENMLITRELKATDGTKVKVKIGIIGETIPNLTGKVESYVGVLKTEDMVANVKTQAANLKKRGADVIVVLAHSGIGPENPEVNFKNVSYALSKIEDVDAILCGHEHNNYPTDDPTSPYIQLPGVDKETFLMNGKNVVMANDRGKAIGLVDLKLEINNGKVQIINRVSSVRSVIDYVTKEDPAITSLYGPWEDKLLQYTDTVIGELDQGESIQNYFGLLEDNTAVQLLNDAKRSHAIRYIHTEGTKYKDYPVISASRYNGFVSVKNKITESDLAAIQPYNNYLILYTISGKQLKEWLEWSASAYEVTVWKTDWTDTTMSDLMKETDLSSLIKEEWLANYSSFFVFDGIDYAINPMFEPRYDLYGNKISNSNRVKSVTYNGKPVTDNMKFILATDKITRPTFAIQGVDQQAVYTKFTRVQAVLADYIENLSKVGSILPTVDNNWTLQISKDYKFIFKAPLHADTLAKQSEWYVNLLKTVDNYNYYTATYAVKDTDTLAPNILLVPSNTAATGIGYDIAVDATDASGIKTIRYKDGDYGLDYGDWNFERQVKDNAFTVSQNGIYSVYAEDNLGNKNVKQIKIDNISPRVIGVPKVETYTNRKSLIKGKAEPGTTVVFETAAGTYETVVDPTGKFSYNLPGQPSGSKITVYALDKETMRSSGKLSVNVKRTGPNQPSVYQIYNNSIAIGGYTNDDDAHVIAIVGNNVYVHGSEGRILFRNAAEIYNSNYNIIETGIKISGDGKYTIDIAPPAVNTSIKVYNIDHIYRVSRMTFINVKEGGPNMPNVYEVSNVEHKITGYVTLRKKNTVVDIYAEVNDNIYQTKTDTEGNFTLDIQEQMQAGQRISVYASDIVEGKRRESAYRTIQVADIENLVDLKDPMITINSLTNNSTEIYGTYYMKNETIYIAIGNKKKDKIYNKIYEITTDEFGDFSYTLPRTLSAGTNVYALARFTDGGIIAAAAQEVHLGKPKTPYIVEEITNSTKKVYVVTSDGAEVTVQIGSKKYKSEKFEYSEELNGYVYEVDTVRTNSGTKVKIYAKNKTGFSKVLETKVLKDAPDSPVVNKVDTDSTKITGTVEIIDNTDATQEQNKPETKVYAMIGKRTYEGTIDVAGNFIIKIKKQKAGTVIYLWGTSQGKRGPLTQIKVSK